MIPGLVMWSKLGYMGGLKAGGGATTALGAVHHPKPPGTVLSEKTSHKLIRNEAEC